MNKKLLIVIIVVVVLVAGFLVWYLLRPQDEVKPRSIEDIVADQTIEDLLVGEASSWKYEADSGRLLLTLAREGNMAEIEDSYSGLASSRIRGTWRFIKDSGKEHLVIDGEFTFGEHAGQKAKFIYGCINVLRQEEFAKEFSAVLSTGDANAQPTCDGQRITYTPWTSN